jgi:hypothetical protein
MGRASPGRFNSTCVRYWNDWYSPAVPRGRPGMTTCKLKSPTPQPPAVAEVAGAV